MACGSSGSHPLKSEMLEMPSWVRCVLIIALASVYILQAASNIGTNHIGCGDEYTGTCHDSAPLVPVFIKLHRIGVITHIHKDTYIHTHTHTYIMYIHTNIHTYMHACTHTYMHTFIHICIHAQMHTCIHTYIHTHIHEFI
jgi:hypothetical protein